MASTSMRPPPVAAVIILWIAAAALATAVAVAGSSLRPAGIALLGGLTAFGAGAVAALRRRRWREGAAAGEPAAAIVYAFDEPAAVTRPDGSLMASNAAWRTAELAQAKLGGRGFEAIAAALREAARSGRAETKLVSGEANRWLSVAKLGQERFLVRLCENLARPLAPARPTGGEGLDAFAAAAPFGAALIAGADAFGSPVVEANSAWTQIAGAAPASGVRLGDLLTGESRTEAVAGLAAGRPGPFEVTLRERRQTAAHLYLSRLDGRWVAYLVDVTEQKQMQAQLAQSGKMQAIGQLAGGVAHDFNNLLTAILMNLSELETRHPLGDPTFEGLARIRENVLRAAGLVGQLLTFSRKVTVQREPLDVGELISNVTVMLRRLLPETVGLETDYGRNLPHVLADRQQLETAVMNLVVNARDAVVGAKGGGQITVRTARLTETEAAARGYEGAPMGEMALIEVADDGPGIPPDVLPKIFDPFFTTKPVGEGTGLGLSTVYGIVKQSDGWIKPVSEPGRGAIFSIFLPVHEPAVLVAPQPAAAPRGRAAARDLSGVGRILFVEDEDAVRRVAARLLRARGYEVLEAADGEEALEIAAANAGAIDLMISDVIMPGLDGPSLLKAARPYLADAPVMFISGYAEAEFSKVLEGERGVSFLAKPIDITTLAEKVKQVLQAA
jgi:two-component system cell cycle sensor histidine kinase/response regulator CckA